MAGNTNTKARTTANESGLLEAVQRFWQKSYVGDYFGFILLLAAYIVIQFDAEPFHRLFRLDDPRIQFPHAEVERVPVFWLFIYAAALPLATLMLWTAIFRPSPHKLHVTLLGLAISILLTSFLTDIFKNAIGRPRPDLLARCDPALDTPVDQLVSIDVCTNTNRHVVQDAWRSFPSGHSSFSFAGLGWMALFFASQTHAIRPRASLATALLSVSPLVGAALVAVSRLEDYRHDVFDVVCGSLLGFAVSYFNWRRYYPCLTSPGCDEPHASPGESGRNSPRGGYARARDEEEGYGTTADRRFSIGEEEGSYDRDSSR
ncbi:PAP2-domain-containing protein [Hortaea werneckii]|nr:PAP2-domain-containing protein [Hortaea werneckii]